MKLLWDQVGERRYETGVDQGVLYIPTNGVYSAGYAWNGLTAVNESPSGAEATPVYADNMKYLNLTSAEDFGGTIEALTYPSQFEQCDGTATPQPGVSVGQQERKPFGFFVAQTATFTEQPEGSFHEPFLRLQLADAQRLMNELWDCGRRPSVGTGSAGSLKETEKHLTDMQRIAFMLLERPNA